METTDALFSNMMKMSSQIFKQAAAKSRAQGAYYGSPVHIDALAKKAEPHLPAAMVAVVPDVERIGLARAVVSSRLANPACAACHKTTGLRRCAICYGRYYCSAACKDAHWDEHRATECLTPNKPDRLAQARAVRDTDERMCTVCWTSVDLRRCSRCRAMPYCRDACQRADWKRHKEECRCI